MKKRRLTPILKRHVLSKFNYILTYSADRTAVIRQNAHLLCYYHLPMVQFGDKRAIILRDATQSEHSQLIDSLAEILKRKGVWYDSILH